MYDENGKMLVKEIKEDLNKYRDSNTVSMAWKTQQSQDVNSH